MIVLFNHFASTFQVISFNSRISSIPTQLLPSSFCEPLNFEVILNFGFRVLLTPNVYHTWTNILLSKSTWSLRITNYTLLQHYITTLIIRHTAIAQFALIIMTYTWYNSHTLLITTRFQIEFREKNLKKSSDRLHSTFKYYVDREGNN